MSDNPTARKASDPQDQIRAAAKRATHAAIEAAHQAADPVEQSGGAAASSPAQDASVTQAGAARRTEGAAAELTRRAGQAIAEGQHRIAESTAAQLQESARSIAQAVQGSAENLRKLAMIPTAAGSGLHDLQEGVGGLIEGVIRTNLRVVEELLHASNPAAFLSLQQRFVREYLDVLMQGSAAIARAAREMADQTLVSLEQQGRQAGQGGQPGAQEGDGRVADVMARNVRVAGPEDTVQHAVQLMRDDDTGVLPVGEGDRLVGMVTDRDVALRLVAEGKDPSRTKVREVMTPEVRYVFEDEALERVADNMAAQKVRRLPVVNRDKRLVGVVSLGDLARNRRAAHLAVRALGGIARPDGQHSQGAAG